MIIVTGGAGFIGSALIWELNRLGEEQILVVDRLGDSRKWKNLVGLRFIDYVHRDDFLKGLNKFSEARAIIHMGACSSTTETDADYLWKNNVHYSMELAKFSIKNKQRFIYASSAATYGGGENGFKDDLTLIPQLQPINRYGYSKQRFDLWVLRKGLENRLVGLKFFNVYGPNEYHKGGMSSLIYQGFLQIKNTEKLKLFKSYREDYKHGEQKRDFIYIKDVVKIIVWLLQNPDKNGILNIGTGKAHSWNELAKSVFDALKKTENIEYIEMPSNIQASYQYFTQADITKLKSLGYKSDFILFKDAIKNYVEHLNSENPFLKMSLQ